MLNCERLAERKGGQKTVTFHSLDSTCFLIPKKINATHTRTDLWSDIMILLICPRARVLLYTFVCLHKINLLKCRDRTRDISGDNSEIVQPKKKKTKTNDSDPTADWTQTKSG